MEYLYHLKLFKHHIYFKLNYLEFIHKGLSNDC